MGKEGYLAGKIGLFYDRRFTGGYVRDNGRGDTGGVEVRGGDTRAKPGLLLVF